MMMMMMMMNGPFAQIAMAVGLLIWMKRILLDPMRITAIEMAHLEPIDILNAPFPMDDLVLFVGGAVTGIFLVSVPWWDPSILLQHVYVTCMTTILLWVVFILCGAHPTHHHDSTALTSLYIASLLTCWNPACMPFHFHHYSKPIQHHSFATPRVYVTLITMVPCSILHILDWGAQIQRWPIPLLLGSTVGHAIGTVVSIIMIYPGTTPTAVAATMTITMTTNGTKNEIIKAT